jgi:hypothetical protein
VLLVSTASDSRGLRHGSVGGRLGHVGVNSRGHGHVIVSGRHGLAVVCGRHGLVGRLSGDPRCVRLSLCFVLLVKMVFFLVVVPVSYGPCHEGK